MPCAIQTHAGRNTLDKSRPHLSPWGDTRLGVCVQ